MFLFHSHFKPIDVFIFCKKIFCVYEKLYYVWIYINLILQKINIINILFSINHIFKVFLWTFRHDSGPRTAVWQTLHQMMPSVCVENPVKPFSLDMDSSKKFCGSADVPSNRSTQT